MSTDKTLLGVQQSIKTSDLNDEALSKYFEASHRPIIFAPYSSMRFKKKKEAEPKPNEPAS